MTTGSHRTRLEKTGNKTEKAAAHLVQRLFSYVFISLLSHHLLAIHDDKALITLIDTLSAEVICRLLSLLGLRIDRLDSSCW